MFGAAAATASLWLMILGRGLTFFYDEWDFIDTRNESFWHDYSCHTMGIPDRYRSQCIVCCLLTVGLQHYWPYRLVLVGMDLLCGLLVFLLLRRRVHAVIGSHGAAAILMLLGPAWQDLLWPFQIGFLGSVAGGLGALYLLGKEERLRASIGAAVCLLAAVSCSAVGVAFVVVVLVGQILDHRWTRLWVPGISLTAFATWYAIEDRTQGAATLPAGGTAMHFLSQAAAAATFGALIGTGTSAGGIFAVIMALLAVFAIARASAEAFRLVGLIAGMIAFWLMTLLAQCAAPIAESLLLSRGCTRAIGNWRDSIC